MAARKDKAEHLIENLAGCGVFQVILMVILFPCVKTMIAYTVMFMVFGSYNPGWRCMDNVTHAATGSILTNVTDGTSGTGTLTTPIATLLSMSSATRAGNSSSGINIKDNEIETDYVFEQCDVFEKCSDVEFDPSTKTVVSEWGLICDRAWVVKVVISFQMLGMLVGSYVSGHLSDVIGRKKTIFIGVLSSSLCQLISSFSVSWIMFCAMRFALGITVSLTLVVIFIYISEFMTRKWRAVIIVLPIWYVGATLMAFSAWIFKDWRNVDRLGFVINAVCCLLLLWVPESLRWLEVKDKTKEFAVVSQKVLRCNRKEIPELEHISLAAGREINENDKTDNYEKDSGKKYTILDLFRKNYRIISICIMYLQFTLSLLYYALSFGAKSLYGNFYLNLVIFNAIPLPLGLISMVIMRAVSRRVHTVIFVGISVGCAIVSIAILLSDSQEAKDFGSTILISVSKGTLDGAWLGIYARNAELYPTVVRGFGMGLGSLSARIGGILAPILIPNDQSVLYIFMIIMSVVAVTIGLVSLRLPETKGKVLKENFDDENNDDDKEEEEEMERREVDA